MTRVDLTPQPPLRRGEGEHRGGVGELGCEVVEGADSRYGADELAAPIDEGIEVAGGCEAGLDHAGKGAEALGGGLGEGKNGVLGSRFWVLGVRNGEGRRG